MKAIISVVGIRHKAERITGPHHSLLGAARRRRPPLGHLKAIISVDGIRHKAERITGHHHSLLGAARRRRPLRSPAVACRRPLTLTSSPAVPCRCPLPLTHSLDLGLPPTHRVASDPHPRQGVASCSRRPAVSWWVLLCNKCNKYITKATISLKGIRQTPLRRPAVSLWVLLCNKCNKYITKATLSLKGILLPYFFGNGQQGQAKEVQAETKAKAEGKEEVEAPLQQ